MSRSPHPSSATAMLGRYTAQVDAQLRPFIRKRMRGAYKELYGMLGYFLGYLDADLSALRRPLGGKRLRPGLTLLLADAYGARRKALGTACAIELFHQYTLIHDDVEDGDERRRGRPTVWKQWGVNQAIHAGDVQLILSLDALPEHEGLRRMLLRAFLEVCEGQYLDLKFSDLPLGSRELKESRYFEMTEKKTGTLFGAAAEAAGIVAGCPRKERANLLVFGRALGTAYQLADDYRSVWASEHETKKDVHSDLRERKRTLPVLRAYQQSSAKSRRLLKQLYALERQLTRSEITEIKELIGVTDAQQYLLLHMRKEVARAHAAAKRLSLSAVKKRELHALADTLVRQA